jgi:hypothetical protein
VPNNEAPTLTVHDLPRAQRLLTLEFGDRAEFDDPKLEYRRQFWELLFLAPGSLAAGEDESRELT